MFVPSPKTLLIGSALLLLDPKGAIQTIHWMDDIAADFCGGARARQMGNATGYVCPDAYSAPTPAEGKRHTRQPRAPADPLVTSLRGTSNDVARALRSGDRSQLRAAREQLERDQRALDLKLSQP